VFLSLQLNRNDQATLQAQMFSQLRALILSGCVRPGAVLPATRVLARQHGISRNTATQVYDRLVSEGYVETVRGSGTRVSLSLPETRLRAPSIEMGPKTFGHQNELAGAAPKTALVFRGTQPQLPETGLSRVRIDFWPGRPNRHLFPVRIWRKLLTEHLTNAGTSLSEYGDPAGTPSLREAIADHLRFARGMNVVSDQVIVTGGSQEGLNIISRLFIQPGTPVVVENPCYQGAALTFASYGASLEPLGLDKDGILVDHLRGRRAALAYVTPSHQFPTGATLPLDRRLHLLNWARQVGAYIVEDDYNSDYRYSGPPLVALAGLEPAGESVIYLGTLSKSLGAGLRTGFLVVPTTLIGPARAVKALLNFGHPWLEQMTAASFISSGAYQRHLRKILRVCCETRDCLLYNLTHTFGANLSLSGVDGGMHVMWRLPSDFPSADQFAAATRGHGALIHTTASSGAVDFDSEIGDRGIILGYAALTETEIRAGVTAMARALDDLTAGSNGPNRVMDPSENGGLALLANP
jgi:GntR family transcriptional regulator/MocR family aminotransferase